MWKKIFVPALAAALFIGGGFTGSIDWFHYNAGFFLAPGAKLRTSTSVSSEDQSGRWGSGSERPLQRCWPHDGRQTKLFRVVACWRQITRPDL